MFLHTILFACSRDALVPAGLWTIATMPQLHTAFTCRNCTLWFLASMSSLTSLWLLQAEPALAPFLQSLSQPPTPFACFAGIASAVAIVGICAVVQGAASGWVLVARCHGCRAVGSTALTEVWRVVGSAAKSVTTLASFRGVTLLVFSVSGNMYEEVLFRAYWVNRVASRVGPVTGVAVSTLVFATMHVFLGYSLAAAGAARLESGATNSGRPARPAALVGLQVQAFTLLEGLVCGIVFVQFGLFPAALTHGLAIFFLSAHASASSPN
jgi:membrane protease YdiL (CAAX protease family)